MTPTQEATNEIKQHLRESLRLLRTLRDEIRLEVHLAGMEAKEKWKSIEPRVEHAERMARNASDASMKALHDTIDAVKNFKGWLRGVAQ